MTPDLSNDYRRREIKKGRRKYMGWGKKEKKFYFIFLLVYFRIIMLTLPRRPRPHPQALVGDKYNIKELCTKLCCKTCQKLLVLCFVIFWSNKKKWPVSSVWHRLQPSLMGARLLARFQLETRRYANYM